MKLSEFGLSATVEDITPEIAAQWLSNNFRHREIKAARVEKFARQMDEGDWQFNGKVIILSDTGMLMNGQHRLSAVVASGKTMRSIVIRGVRVENYQPRSTGNDEGSGSDESLQ